MRRRNIDTVLLSGWLFADLFLGLLMIFLVSIPGMQPRPVTLPTLSVTPLHLDPTSPNCTGGTDAPQCTVMLSETPASISSMTWTASSDISNTISFSPPNGALSPKKTVTVTISALPCQNGSFTFAGMSGAYAITPVVVIWQCKAPPPPVVRLDFKYAEFKLNVDPNGLLNNSQPAINDVMNQVRSQQVLQGRSVGLAIVYGGAPDTGSIGQAQNVANKIYGILAQLGQQHFAFQRASYYVPLYDLDSSANIAVVDVYLFEK